MKDKDALLLAQRAPRNGEVDNRARSNHAAERVARIKHAEFMRQLAARVNDAWEFDLWASALWEFDTEETGLLRAGVYQSRCCGHC